MRIIASLLLLFIINANAIGWGQTGHRAIGLIAQKHLSKKAKKKLQQLLVHESLAVVSVWMDEERSNPTYDHTHDWHWVTVHNGKTYADMDKNPKGDIIQTITRLVDELEKGGLTKEEEVIHIKMLVHLIGDIHMPLHVGTGEDKGGNDLKVKWFGKSSNLHRVWDSEIIDSKQFSYTELAAAVDHVSDKTILAQWQNNDINVWVKEAMDLREEVYNLPEDKRLGYQYMYDHWDTVQLRLHKAGVRLAGVLNKIYQ